MGNGISFPPLCKVCYGAVATLMVMYTVELLYLRTWAIILRNLRILLLMCVLPHYNLTCHMAYACLIEVHAEKATHAKRYCLDLYVAWKKSGG